MFYRVHKFEDTGKNLKDMYPQILLFGNVDNESIFAYKFTIDGKLALSSRIQLT